MKFKVGDRVKVVNEAWSSIYTVEEVTSEGVAISCEGVRQRGVWPSGSLYPEPLTTLKPGDRVMVRKGESCKHWGGNFHENYGIRMESVFTEPQVIQGPSQGPCCALLESSYYVPLAACTKVEEFTVNTDRIVVPRPDRDQLKKLVDLIASDRTRPAAVNPCETENAIAPFRFAEAMTPIQVVVRRTSAEMSVACTCVSGRSRFCDAVFGKGEHAGRRHRDV